MGFQQEDLCEDDVMILDTWYDLFVWVGTRSNAEERRRAMETAKQYVLTDPCKRDPNLSIYQVKQGHEPVIFTGESRKKLHSFWYLLKNCHPY